MANQLAMDKVLAIQGLASRGYSERRIAEALQISRKAVRRHLGRDLGLSASKDTKAPTGEAPTGSTESKDTTAPLGSAAPLADSSANAAPAEAGQAIGQSSSPPAIVSRSLCQTFQGTIVEKLAAGLTAQRIYQDLCDEHGFAGKYSSVRRFVFRLGKQSEPPFRRMEVAPGSEVQVDYGSGARCLDREGKLKRTYVFRLVLGHSRKGYSEAVWRLTTESFIRSLENAFWALGGVPETIVFDNAKSAVQEADWFDPLLNPKIIDFCRHYNTTLLPTRPRTPRHKGKVERGVGYVKGNALRGRTFESLAAQNEFLREWERKVADTRIHGTTKQHVGKQFETVERAALGPLPTERFAIFEEGQRTVSRDGHIEVKRTFYSTPPEYVGCRVWVRWNEQTVRILNENFKQIAIHPRQSPGKFSTRREDVASQKIGAVERGAEYLLGKVRSIGPHASRWAEAAITERGVQGMRTIQGLLALRRKFADAAVEAACDTAWRSRGFSYRSVKNLLKQDAAGRVGAKQQTLGFIETHPVIRPLDEYGAFVKKAISETPLSDPSPPGE
jgi:transposase